MTPILVSNSRFTRCFEYHRDSGEDVEGVSRTIQKTPIGQFSVYHSHLDTAGDLQDVSNAESRKIESLEDNKFISITGKVRRTPLNVFNHRGEEYGLYAESDFDERVRRQLSKAGAYFEVPMGNVDGSVIFKLSDEYFQPIIDPANFPEEYQPYTVMGEIKHRYRANEQKHHMDIIEDVEIRDRNKKAQLEMQMKQMVKSSEALVGRPVSEDDFHLSEPDLLIDPIAIYR